MTFEISNLQIADGALLARPVVISFSDMISWNRKLIVCYIILVLVQCTVNISAFASTHHKSPKRQSYTHLMNQQPLEDTDNVQRIVLIGVYLVITLSLCLLPTLLICFCALDFRRWRSCTCSSYQIFE